MSQILDNPIWHALTEDNAAMALGNKIVKFIRRDIGFFAGFERNNQRSLKELATLLPAGSQVVLFVPKAVKIPLVWSILAQRPLLQMIYAGQHILPEDRTGIVPLTDRNIPAMLRLTALTNPGPFLQRTIEFGNYEGIFKGGQLIAMAGRRLQPAGFAEVSAVCTHPKHIGKGLAAKLLTSQVNRILQSNKVPFLHAYPDNPAVYLYKKIGFTERKMMQVYFLERNQELTATS